ncbi:MAG: hypothetical protein JSU58_06205 [Dehalococcoidales bacterium]|nr:MAG: hypothetical protein JSU58_06205 [Dehalococcoidales bacterium]
MWRKRKFIVMLLGAILVIAASIGGVAMAQDSEEDSQPDSLVGRVAAILGIEQQTVEDAFKQAQAEMQEAALDKYLQNLVDEGIISEAEAAEYKAWIEARPDMSEYFDKMKDWAESKPAISNMPRFKTFGIFRGWDGMRIFDGLCLPCL